LDDQKEFLVKIKEGLSTFTSINLSTHTNLRPAAVLVPLLFDKNVWKCLFIRRSDIGEFHKGEVAFPGGGKEVEDKDLIQTALRETYEELGIESKEIEILGTLPEMTTISNYVVTPVIGIIQWPVKIQLNQDEVARVFAIPISWLMDSSNWNINEFEFANRGKVKTIVYNTFDEETLWGFTARITQILVALIKKEER
jgi:8-oxo-dGTP pyrophosphatase MutT (NUDIX family)